MFDPIPIAIVAAAIGAFVLLVVGMLIVQARAHGHALAGQKRALSQVDESLDLSRRSVDNAERMLDLAERSVKQQEEMIRLLRELVGREGVAIGPAAFGGVRLPVGGPPAP